MKLRGWLTTIAITLIFAFFTASIFSLQTHQRQMRDHFMYSKGQFDQAMQCKRTGAFQETAVENPTVGYRNEPQ